MEFPLPQIGEGVYEAELVRWLVAPGDTVQPGQGLMEVMTDKATMEVPAPFAGRIERLSAEPGGPVKVGQPILSYARLDEQPEDSPTTATPQPPARKSSNGRSSPAAEPQRTDKAATLPPAAPSVRLLARKLGVDLSRLQGSGPNGRILVDDVTTVYEQSRAAAVARLSQRTHTPLFDLGRPGTRVKLAGLRRLTAERMTLSAQTIPQATYVEETNVTDLVRLRESLKPTLEQRGSRLTYLPFMVKAVALALREVPIVNASLEDASREIVLHDHYHIGVAVATPNGLIVPVVKDADQLDLLGIASEIERLSTDARAGKSSRDDLQGATFTITSVGNFGGILSTPMVNPPEAAILGIGRIVRRPVFDDRGQVVPADLVHLSLTFDHRLLDGAVAAVFVNAIVSHLRAPAALLLPPA